VDEGWDWGTAGDALTSVKCMNTCEWCELYFCLLDDIKWTASSIMCCFCSLHDLCSHLYSLFIGRNVR
jgi:hypothetical protein